MVRGLGALDFVLCLGYRGEIVKEYFLEYNEALANDFVLSNGGRDVELLGATSGLAHHLRGHRRTGDDRRAAQGRRVVHRQAVFLATAATVSPTPLDEMVATLERSGKTGLFVSVRPRLEDHVVPATATSSSRSRASRLETFGSTGYFVFRREIFDVIEAARSRREALRAADRAMRGSCLPYDGFWEPMDTIKDKQKLGAS